MSGLISMPKKQILPYSMDILWFRNGQRLEGCLSNLVLRRQKFDFHTFAKQQMEFGSK
jgi:hypothetical protein